MLQTFIITGKNKSVKEKRRMSTNKTNKIIIITEVFKIFSILSFPTGKEKKINIQIIAIIAAVPKSGSKHTRRKITTHGIRGMNKL